MVEVNDLGQVEVVMPANNRRIPTSFGKHLVTFDDETVFEFSIEGDKLLAGGIVVVRNILEWARQLDPVACCNFLKLELHKGQVPHHLLLTKRSKSKALKAILADARMMFTLCNYQQTPYHELVTYHRIAVDEGECS